MYLQKPSTVTFDPSIKAHRQAAAKFLKRLAWRDSPIRFSHDPSYGSVADQIRSKLLQWYVDREMNGRNKQVQLPLDLK